MKCTAIAVGLTFAATACQTVEINSGPDYNRPLPPGASALIPLGPDEAAPNLGHVWLERASVRPALENSLRWTRMDYANQFFPIAGITHERALRSLQRFSELMEESTSPEQFETAVAQEFQVYKSAGWDGRGGGVLYTAYYTPILDGSLWPDDVYRYALYALPPDLEKAVDGTILGQRTEAGLAPYPSRRIIEANRLLDGMELELVYLRDPLDAFIAHVNGSAIVRLNDGTDVRLGYSGKNGRKYTSLGAELVKDGFIGADQLSLSSIRAWARAHPDLVTAYLDRNASYVFFTPIDGPPRGSLNVTVSPQRTLATDKALFPRGAIVYVDTTLPMEHGGRAVFRQLMFDQDTGGAIRTAGRADIYLGMGPEAEHRAGSTRSTGQLYYFFLRQ